MSGKHTNWDDVSDIEPEADQMMSDGSSHIIPISEIDPLHLCHFTCWCGPDLLDKTDLDEGKVYIHKVVN